MTINWRNRPTTIDNIPRSIDYIVSIDESGNPNLKQVLKAKRQGISVVDSEKHFTVMACLFDMADVEEFRDEVMKLKHKYWDSALYEYKDGHCKRVCFHSKEIRGHKGAFDSNLIDYDSFILDLSSTIQNAPVSLYAAHIDKEALVRKYINPYHPYDLCMTFILERILLSIPKDATCVVILEARGAKEDQELLNYVKKVVDNGTQYITPRDFKRIKGVYFNPKWSKEDDGQTSYWELEIADLCAYPIQKYFAYGTEDPAFKTVLPKLDGYPYYVGRGLKSFP